MIQFELENRIVEFLRFILGAEETLKMFTSLKIVFEKSIIFWLPIDAFTSDIETCKLVAYIELFLIVKTLAEKLLVKFHEPFEEINSMSKSLNASSEARI